MHKAEETEDKGDDVEERAKTKEKKVKEREGRVEDVMGKGKYVGQAEGGRRRLCMVRLGGGKLHWEQSSG